MPNPNYSELKLLAKYGEEDSDDAQDADIYNAISEDSDEIDHKFVYGVPLGGVYVELVHYVSVKQVILQNMSAFNGSTFYIDDTTGDLVAGFVLPGEHVSFCDPNIGAGIMLYSIAVAEPTEWHIAIIGRKD